ncbi:AfsA-related hotdog domain-containing protein [Streptomyces sp. NPDC054834]
MSNSAPVPAPRGRTGRHLVHRPHSFDPLAVDTPADRVQEFVLAGELPAGHPLFGDGPGHFHDAQAALAMVRQVSEGIGQGHFGIPADRVGVFYRFGLDIGDVGAWRRHGGPGTLAVTMRVRPDKVISGIPRALEFGTRLEIDGIPAGTGSASLLFLAPLLHRSHREHSRATALASAGQDTQAAGHGGAHRPAEPDTAAPAGPGAAEVGRSTPGNVLLREPLTVDGSRLSVAVRPPHTWPAVVAQEDGVPAPALLLEVLRQTALLAAHRLRGLDPRHSTPAALHTHFRGYAEPDLPLRCVAVAQDAGQDALGRPLVPLTLTLTQAGRAVTEATVSVVEDL